MSEKNPTIQDMLRQMKLDQLANVAAALLADQVDAGTTMNDRDHKKIETMRGLIRESTDEGLYAGRQEWSEAVVVPDDLREAIVMMADEEIARRGLPALGET